MKIALATVTDRWRGEDITVESKVLKCDKCEAWGLEAQQIPTHMRLLQEAWERKHEVVSQCE